MGILDTVLLPLAERNSVQEIVDLVEGGWKSVIASRFENFACSRRSPLVRHGER